MEGKIMNQVGDIAPIFKLRDIEGNEVQLNDFIGNYVVIEFGSYT